MDKRLPAVAGQFYPEDETELRAAVAGHLDAADVEACPERVTALMAPHAGYVFSGPTAGCAYARVRGKKPGRVIVIGCSHRSPIDNETASVDATEDFHIPGHTFSTDAAFAKQLAEATHSRSNYAHLFEHSIEVQLPFVLGAVGDVPLVPVLVSGPATAWHAEAGRKLAALTDDNDLVIASTDLSHYLSDNEAAVIDKHTLELVLAQDIERLIAELGADKASMCGGAAVIMTMAYALARGATDWRLLDYRTSAAASGDAARVVGYGAISMERPG